MSQLRAIRGATTASANTIGAIREAVEELLDAIETYNQFQPEEVISVIFSVTKDLDVIFPAAIARERTHWQKVPLLDLQQMHVEGSLERCIRILIHLNLSTPPREIVHLYLRQARNLRPEWGLEALMPSSLD